MLLKGHHTIFVQELTAVLRKPFWVRSRHRRLATRYTLFSAGGCETWRVEQGSSSWEWGAVPSCVPESSDWGVFPLWRYRRPWWARRAARRTGDAPGDPLPPCPCAGAGQRGWSVPGSPHAAGTVMRSGTQWQGRSSAVGTVQKKYAQRSRNFRVPTFGVCAAFRPFGQGGKQVCKVKTEMGVGFHFSLHGHLLDKANERCPQVSMKLDLKFRLCGGGREVTGGCPPNQGFAGRNSWVGLWKLLSPASHLAPKVRLMLSFKGLLVWWVNGVNVIIISLYIFSGSLHAAQSRYGVTAKYANELLQQCLLISTGSVCAYSQFTRTRSICHLWPLQQGSSQYVNNCLGLKND